MPKTPQFVMCKNTENVNRQYKAPHILRNDFKPDRRFKNSKLPPSKRMTQ